MDAQSQVNGVGSNKVVDEWDNWDPMGEDFRSPKNTLALNPEKDPLSQITGESGQAANKVGGVIICEHFLKKGRCADGQYCDRVHVDRITKQRVDSIEPGDGRKCMNSSFLSPVEYEPDPTVLHLVTVTVAKSPQNFYMIVPYGTQNFCNYDFEALQFYIDTESKSSARRKLADLHDKMAKLFNVPYRFDDPNSEIYLGQIVACKLPNSHYRRAMVIETPDYSEDKFLHRLKLIDYGTEVELPRESIFDLKAGFLSEPPLAIHARLGIKPVDGTPNWSRQAREVFLTESKGGNSFLLCRISDYARMDEMFIVDLLDMKSRRSLSQKLVDMELAVKC